MEQLSREGELTRRAFVGGAAATGAAIAMSNAPSIAVGKKRRTGRYRERARVDVHAHHLPPAYLEALHSHGIGFIGGLPIPSWSPDSALDFMDRYGIRFQMLSISDPGVSFVSGSDAVDLARQCNEYAASVAQAHPGNFGAFAVIPLPQVEAAIAEVGHALDALGHDGVGLLSSYQGMYLGDPSFEALLAELDRRRAWVFVHPTAVPADDKPSLQVPDFVYEYPFDTARTIVSLLFNASFKRYPHIRWQFAHGGGAVAMLRFRLDVLADASKEAAGLILPAVARDLVRKDADDALAGNFFDTALIADPPELEAVRHLTGYRHVLFGSDWPFASRIYPANGDPAPLLSQTFTDSERHAVERLNAAAQFPRLRGVLQGPRKRRKKGKR